jgi:hypothetical protein
MLLRKLDINMTGTLDKIQDVILQEEEEEEEEEESGSIARCEEKEAKHEIHLIRAPSVPRFPR